MFFTFLHHPPTPTPKLENGAKRKKIISGVGIGVQHSVSKASSDKGIRRSTRHHKLRGEKALIVSANQTLKELKIQVMISVLRTEKVACGFG